MTQPFVVNVKYPSGVVDTLTPIRTAADQVILATPLYLDPRTGTTTSASIQLSITQGTLASNTFQVSIQDLPAVSTYGTAPGEISRAFFNYLAQCVARNLNYFQALAAFPANKTDTTGLRASLLQQLQDTIKFRSNIDMLMAGTQTSLAVGKADDGTPIQFNSTSLDLLDRILGYRLLSSGYLSSPGTAPSSAKQVLARQSVYGEGDANAPQYRIRRTPSGVLSVARAHPVSAQIAHQPEIAGGSLGSLASVFQTLSTVGGATGFFNGVVGAAQQTSATNTALDNLASAVGGVASIAGLATASPEIATGAALVGTAVGLYTFVHDAYNVATSPEAASLTDVARMGFEAVATITAPFAARAVGTGWVRTLTTKLEKLGSDGVSGVLLQGGGFISNAATADIGVLEIAKNSQSEHAAAPAQQLGQLDGTTAVLNSNGATSSLAGLPGAAITDVGTSSNFTTLCGQDGKFELTIPLGVSGFDYSQMHLFAYDPVTGVPTGAAQDVDLTKMSATTPLEYATPVGGTCNDPDAGTPDSDDPDCD